MLNKNVKDTALSQFEADIRYFKVVETDEAFKVNFSDVNNVRQDAAVFEWATNSEKTKLGIIFTLNAESLFAAGVDPEKVVGWDYAENSDGDKVLQKVIDLNA